jgi:dihydroorotate dehydrogenase
MVPGMIDDLYRLAKPLLFRLDPETVHDRVVGALGRASTSGIAMGALRRGRQPADTRLSVDLGGITLPGPIGIAAGLDKNGVAWPAFGALGWDYVEVGTITLQPQPGNPKPRMFRLPEDDALINRMGFPSRGADEVALAIVQRRKSGIAFGCNIGPNKESVAAGLDAVVRDCTELARRFSSLAGYLVLNISSPNTARLRELQGADALHALLSEVKAAIPERAACPLFVKIAPDLTADEVSGIVDVVLKTGIAGIVATNTTIARPDSLRGTARSENGGLSGAPLRERSLRIVHQIATQTGGKLPILAAGGIASGADAIAAIEAGAWAVQIYTGLIYEGPGLANRIRQELIAHLDRTGATSLADIRSP